jgi:membrane protein YdbS with pleckstrin-like domain
MGEYSVNRCIGRNAEFKGLKAQYLFIFAGGLLAVFIIFVIMYMAGISQWICIGFGAVMATLLVWLTFSLNRRYGEHGLMKLQALRRHPRYIVNRLRIFKLFRKT